LGALWLWLGLVLLAGCSTAQRTTFDSHASYNRTFDVALAAISDQRMVASTVDRRQGQIVAERNGDKVEVNLTLLQHDGAVRINFAALGESHADAELLTRVIASYNARMSNQSILGGFRDSGNSKGPVPCPSGPAFCP
jgi:hypothetical protein